MDNNNIISKQIVVLETPPGKSSGEKYKRATLLNKSVINHMRGEKYNHRRITHFDISVY